MKKEIRWIISIIIVVLLVAGYYVIQHPPQFLRQGRSVKVLQFIRNPEEHQDWILPAGTICTDAPFQFPTDGFVGYLWGDSFRPGHNHSGLDIFSGTEPGVTPIYAVYDGYLTRESDWISTVIVRIPSDPLNPGRQIWTYYTHMADKDGISAIREEFPAGTHEVFVEAGTLLGYMGNYSGTPGNPTGVHLHLSIVKDDGNGNYLNETEIKNTLDPSAYLGMNLRGASNAGDVPMCLNTAP
ncbi:MAG: M23 family metallopeptidase [Anaerolineaceae bacterium]|nr:M23 family metallopeptidase [Anaerolineaceae bacterium]